MPDLWTDLLECLELAPTPSVSNGETPDVTAFEGRNQHLEYHRLFGGQLLGQSIQAARLMCPDKAVTSVHTVFAREGRAHGPVFYEAVRHHEGRSFATVTVTARQGGDDKTRSWPPVRSACMWWRTAPNIKRSTRSLRCSGPSIGSRSISSPGRHVRPSTSEPPPPVPTVRGTAEGRDVIPGNDENCVLLSREYKSQKVTVPLTPVQP